eukprot:scaffold16738_cov17-Tisochrysis_lutea.AAC.1
MPDEMLPDVAIAGKMDGFLGRRGSLCNDLCAKGAREQTGLVAWCEHGAPMSKQGCSQESTRGYDVGAFMCPLMTFCMPSWMPSCSSV